MKNVLICAILLLAINGILAKELKNNYKIMHKIMERSAGDEGEDDAMDSEIDQLQGVVSPEPEVSTTPEVSVTPGLTEKPGLTTKHGGNPPKRTTMVRSSADGNRFNYFIGIVSVTGLLICSA